MLMLAVLLVAVILPLLCILWVWWEGKDEGPQKQQAENTMAK
jgi:hypothetical protein